MKLKPPVIQKSKTAARTRVLSVSVSTNAEVAKVTINLEAKKK